MNSYIKHIVEAFDFNSVSRQKNSVNIYALLQKIVDKIIHDDELLEEEKEFILSLPTGSYKADNQEIFKLVKNSIKQLGNNCNLNWIDTSDIEQHSMEIYLSGMSVM